MLRRLGTDPQRHGSRPHHVRHHGTTRGGLHMSPTLTDELLSVAEICAELKISRRTFYRWRELRIGPGAIKLPNGEIRVPRSLFAAWLAKLQECPA